MENGRSRRNPAFLWNKITSQGTGDTLSLTLNNRIRAINQFCSLCIVYAFFYILFSFYANLHFSGYVFIAVALLFALTIYLNSTGKYFLAKMVLLITTNSSVILLSMYYGFVSGIHLYYFTSPLISFCLFGYTEKRKLTITMFSYFLLFMLLFYLNYSVPVDGGPVFNISSLYMLYIVNAALSFSICILLVVYFSKNTYDINTELIEANRVLRQNKVMLENEITTRKKAEEIISVALEEKEVLLSEIHHRVKNNLAIIYGLMELQNQSNEDGKSKELFTVAMNRIRSISLLHEKLYQSDNFSRINLFSYVKDLKDTIHHSYGMEIKKIDFPINIDESIAVSVKTALPLGLLLNELISNSVKHAFSEKEKGTISISFTTNKRKIRLVYTDDGRGFDSSVIPGISLGQKLIVAFIKQLDATGGYQGSHNGVCFKIEFEETKNRTS